MAVLKYPFYFVVFIFVVLTVYSLSTEKPRQYKAKPIEESVTKPVPELWGIDEAISNAAVSGSRGGLANPTNPGVNKSLDQGKGKAHADANGKALATPAPTSMPAPTPTPTPTPTQPSNVLANTANTPTQSNPNVVVAYSNNDVGGKIVLTVNKCEKLPGTVAYTTAPDGKVDYGCWTFDELFIVINWDKAGINNYTYDRFFDITSKERLAPKHLFEVAKDSVSKSKVTTNPVLTQTGTQTATPGATGVTAATTPTPTPFSLIPPQINSTSNAGKK